MSLNEEMKPPKVEKDQKVKGKRRLRQSTDGLSSDVDSEKRKVQTEKGKRRVSRKLSSTHGKKEDARKTGSEARKAKAEQEITEAKGCDAFLKEEEARKLAVKDGVEKTTLLVKVENEPFCVRGSYESVSRRDKFWEYREFLVAWQSNQNDTSIVDDIARELWCGSFSKFFAREVIEYRLRLSRHFNARESAGSTSVAHEKPLAQSVFSRKCPSAIPGLPGSVPHPDATAMSSQVILSKILFAFIDTSSPQFVVVAASALASFLLSVPPLSLEKESVLSATFTQWTRENIMKAKALRLIDDDPTLSRVMEAELLNCLLGLGIAQGSLSTLLTTVSHILSSEAPGACTIDPTAAAKRATFLDKLQVWFEECELSDITRANVLICVDIDLKTVEADLHLKEGGDEAGDGKWKSRRHLSRVDNSSQWNVSMHTVDPSPPPSNLTTSTSTSRGNWKTYSLGEKVHMAVGASGHVGASDLKLSFIDEEGDSGSCRAGISVGSQNCIVYDPCFGIARITSTSSNRLQSKLVTRGESEVFVKSPKWREGDVRGCVALIASKVYYTSMTLPLGTVLVLNAETLQEEQVIDIGQCETGASSSSSSSAASNSSRLTLMTQPGAVFVSMFSEGRFLYFMHVNSDKGGEQRSPHDMLPRHFSRQEHFVKGVITIVDPLSNMRCIDEVELDTMPFYKALEKRSATDLSNKVSLHSKMMHFLHASSWYTNGSFATFLSPPITVDSTTNSGLCHSICYSLSNGKAVRHTHADVPLDGDGSTSPCIVYSHQANMTWIYSHQSKCLIGLRNEGAQRHFAMSSMDYQGRHAREPTCFDDSSSSSTTGERLVATMVSSVDSARTGTDIDDVGKMPRTSSPEQSGSTYTPEQQQECRKSSTLAAQSILESLARNASYFLLSQCDCDCDDGEAGVESDSFLRKRFCVDVCKETFGNLYGICRHAMLALLEGEKGTGEGYLLIILFAVKILRANIYRLIQSNVFTCEAGISHEDLAMCDKNVDIHIASSKGEKDRAEPEVKPFYPQPCEQYVIYHLRLLLFYLSSWEYADLSSLLGSLSRLRMQQDTQLHTTVFSNKDIGMHDSTATVAVQIAHEARECLSHGFELFYPSFTSQRKVLQVLFEHNAFYPGGNSGSFLLRSFISKIASSTHPCAFLGMSRLPSAAPTLTPHNHSAILEGLLAVMSLEVKSLRGPQTIANVSTSDIAHVIAHSPPLQLLLAFQRDLLFQLAQTFSFGKKKKKGNTSSSYDLNKGSKASARQGYIQPPVSGQSIVDSAKLFLLYMRVQIGFVRKHITMLLDNSETPSSTLEGSTSHSTSTNRASSSSSNSFVASSMSSKVFEEDGMGYSDPCELNHSEDVSNMSETQCRRDVKDLFLVIVICHKLLSPVLQVLFRFTSDISFVSHLCPLLLKLLSTIRSLNKFNSASAGIPPIESREDMDAKSPRHLSTESFELKGTFSIELVDPLEQSDNSTLANVDHVRTITTFPTNVTRIMDVIRLPPDTIACLKLLPSQPSLSERTGLLRVFEDEILFKPLSGQIDLSNRDTLPETDIISSGT